MKFAVVGSGISGLSMALILSQDDEVILYEVDDRFGGHSNTIEVNYNDKKIMDLIQYSEGIHMSFKYPSMEIFENCLQMVQNLSPLSHQVKYF